MYWLVAGVLVGSPVLVSAQSRSVAREWNEVLLEAIRVDYARPTVHARNLLHSAIASYDAWAVFDDEAQPFVLGGSLAGVACPYVPTDFGDDSARARAEAISYANYRLLTHRFSNSPGADESRAAFDSLHSALGNSQFLTSTDYSSGSASGLGNYIAKCIIDAGLQDGSNEQNDYANTFYSEVNPPLLPILPGNPDVVDPNRFQPLGLRTFIDQGGNVFAAGVPDFLSAEWGNVAPFALTSDDLTVFTRNGDTYQVYHDPGLPSLLDLGSATSGTVDYQWGFSLVAAWASHLDPTDGVLWDISPGSMGNNSVLPTTMDGIKDFFNVTDGGDTGTGRTLNPRTSEPYAANVVPRGDFTRVLAEFWADGPDSETPPGHWFTILNYVNDHPLLEKRFEGRGEVVDDIEWDVKGYLALGGAVHDAAISAWSIKGWYDYVRPISAIRSMADRGQCTDPGKANYTPDGIPLSEGFIEMVEEGDPLAGLSNENVDKVKIFSWRGPDFIADPEIDDAGVGWILAENWWPYQRPTFVTPPFAGYVSGHSTFSRAAAEVLTLLTGDEFFPGGIGEFIALKDEFLVFEEGPSVDVTLQWATYRDASDQTSISRIWGGIHPPVDDLPGRLIGEKVGVAAFNLAKLFFRGEAEINGGPTRFLSLYPNPVGGEKQLTVGLSRLERGTATVYDMTGREVLSVPVRDKSEFKVSFDGHPAGAYIVRFAGPGGSISRIVVVI